MRLKMSQQAAGVGSYFPNTLVNTLKTAVWCSLLERTGDSLMLDLILNAAVFVKVERGNVVQLTGVQPSCSRHACTPPSKSSWLELCVCACTLVRRKCVQTKTCA
jgi:hypothetical protein